MDIEVEGKVTRTLLDTGSMINTISEKLAQSLGIDCQPLGGLLCVEAANGNFLQYLGYVEASIKLPSLENSTMDVLLLVVEDTRYNESVPVLIRTNVLHPAFETSSSSSNQTKSTS